MYLLIVWIFMGLAAGWLAGRSLGSSGHGRSRDVVMGAGGGLLGGLLLRSPGFSGFGETLITTFAAICGAQLFTTYIGMINGRRISSLPL